MNLIDKTYLYPVLRPGYDDITNSSFAFELYCNIGASKYIANVEAELKNSTIEEMIAAGKAKIYAFIYCAANFYRNTIELKSLHDEFSIPINELKGIVEVVLVITAAENMKYQNAFQHSDYENLTFDISIGNILAVSAPSYFKAEKEFDSLQKVKSIISVVNNQDSSNADPLRVNWNNDKITVTMSNDVYNNYFSLTKDAHWIPNSVEILIFLPILVEIISEWRKESDVYQEEYKQFRWFRAIYARAEALGILEDIAAGTESPFVLAQKMLDAPITRCFDEIVQKRDTIQEGN